MLMEIASETRQVYINVTPRLNQRFNLLKELTESESPDSTPPEPPFLCVLVLTLSESL